MSLLILGGNECMERRYEELCRQYSHQARVYTNTCRRISDIGSPDLIVCFTGTMSHKMLKIASGQAQKKKIPVVHCRTSSLAALKMILDTAEK